MDPIAAPKELLSWMECLFFMGAFFLTLAGCWKLLRGPKPQPPNEQLKQSQAELERRIEENEENQKALAVRMAADKEQIMASGSNRGKTIFAKIDDTRRELQNEVKHVRDRMDPIVENLSHIKGSMEAFTESFKNFTDIVKSQNRKTE